MDPPVHFLELDGTKKILIDLYNESVMMAASTEDRVFMQLNVGHPYFRSLRMHLSTWSCTLCSQ